MAIQTGVAKRVVAKKETTWGTAAGATGARYFRRVTSDIDLAKDTYASNEIVDTYQISDYRHGARRVAGTIAGELSPGAYFEFMESALRRDFTAVTDITAVTITVASTTALNGVAAWTITRGAGDWYADGVRVGAVIRVTAGLANAANINKNLVVMAMASATVITVIPLNGVAMAAEGPTSSTVELPGMVTYVPATGHTNDSYSIEHVFSDITQRELVTGRRVSSLAVNLPAQGIATVDVGVMGKDVETGTTAYFTTPTAASTKGVVAAVNGVVKIGSIPVGVVTGMNFSVDGGMTVGQVVGSNFTPDVFAGRVNVTGQFTAYFDGVTNRDAFLNETEVALAMVFATGTGAAADFISFVMPRVKLGGATKSDGEQGLILTCPFQALYNNDGDATDGDENTTIWIQDSNDTMA